MAVHFHDYGRKKVIVQGALYTVKLQMLIEAAFVFSSVCCAVAGWCLTTSQGPVQRSPRAGCQELGSHEPFQNHH